MRGVPDDPGRPVAGDLIRRIMSCPRVAAPVVRSRFCMRPGDRCAVAAFQWWGSIWRRKTKTGRTLCRTVVARVSVGSVQGGGAGVGGRGEARTSRTHGEKQCSSSPPIHRYALLVTPVSSPRILFRSFSFLRKQGNHSKHCRRVPRHSVGIQPFSQKPRTQTVTPLLQIGLHGVAEADL